MKNHFIPVEENYHKTELGFLPKNWKIQELGNLSKFIVPQRNKPKKFDGNIPWVRIEDFDGKYLFRSKSHQRVSKETIKEMRLRPFPIGSVLCSCSGNMGICAITKEVLVSNQTFIGIVPDNNLNAEYLYYLLGFSKQRLTKLGIGVTIKYISKNKFKTLKIQLPPYSEQEKIAATLWAIQEATEKTTNVILRLQDFKKSLMKHLFTYGPISFKDVNKIKLKKTEVGDFNKAWKVSRLDGIAEVIMGQSPKGVTYNTKGEGLPLINGPTEFGPRHPHILQWTTKPTKLCHNNDILFCFRGNTLGRLNIANQGYCIGRGIAAIREKKGKTDTMFLYYYLEKRAEVIYRMCEGVNSTFPNISGANLRKIEVVTPPLSIQKQIASILYRIDNTIQTEINKKVGLENFFKSMLQSLMKAEIRVANWED